MKKILIVCLVLVGCQSKESQLTAQAETYLKNQLKDPASYAPISKAITDTVMWKAWLYERYGEDTLELSRAQRKLVLDSLTLLLDGFTGKDFEKFHKPYLETVAFRQGNVDTRTKQIAALKLDSIFYINLKFNYRAKNSMGALDIYQSNVKYYPKDKSFVMQE